MNPPNQNPPDQKRLLLAVALCGGILVVWNQFIAPPPVKPPPAVTQTGAKTDAGPASADPQSPATDKVADVAPDAPTRPAIERSTIATLISADVARVELTNDDGQIAAWVLEEPQYRARTDGSPKDTKPFRFIDGIALDTPPKYGTFLPPLLKLNLDGAPAVGEYSGSASGTDATVSWQDPKTGMKVTRAYSLNAETYSTAVTITLENTRSTPVPYDLTADLRGVQNDEEAGGSMFSPPIHLYEGLCRRGDDFEREKIADVQDDLGDPEDPTRYEDGIQWGGVNNRYFMAAIGAPAGEIEACEFFVDAKAVGLASDGLPAKYSYITTRIELTGGEVPANGKVTRTFNFYGGPKKLNILSGQDPSMDDAIDFGFFAPICVPMLAVMRGIHGAGVGWGWAIILLTLLVKLLTFPLTQKQYKSMAAMKKVAPQQKKIQEKYKDDKARLQQEMMKLYKEHKVNPLAGCLPLVLMMPVYFSLYRTIYSAVELYQAEFIFWITDLSVQDPYYVTPVLLGVLMFIQTRLNPQTSDNPQAKIMMNVMPIMFTGMMLFLPSGLVLYIFVNTLLGITQQYLILNKITAVPAKA